MGKYFDPEIRWCEAAPCWLRDRRETIVQNGEIATAGGASSGVQRTLRVVARNYGNAVAPVTGNFMEYRCDLWKSSEHRPLKPEVVSK